MGKHVLRPADLRRALDALVGVVGAGDLDAFAAAVLRALAPLVDAPVSGYNEVDPRRRRFAFVVNPPSVATPEVVEAWVRHAHQNPLLQRVQQNPGDLAVRKITDHVTQAEFRRTELCRSVYQAFGAEYQIALPLDTAGGVAVAVVFNRARDFTERDRAVLTLVQPHVIRAYRNAAAVTDLRVARQALADTFAALRPPVALVSRERRLLRLASHDEARHALGAGAVTADEADDGDGALADEVIQWLARPDANGNGKPGGAGAVDDRTLSLARGGRRPTEVLLVARADDGAALLSVRPAPANATGATARRYGLTRREAEVLRCLGAGLTNKQIAAALHVTARTAEKHVEHVLQKLGVPSRTAACAIAVQLWPAGR